MKVLKRTRRRNFRVNTAYYRESGLEYLLSEGVIEQLGEDHYVVYVCDSNTVNVVFSDVFDDYITVVKTNTGHDVIISL